jgi:hypothetical protein
MRPGSQVPPAHVMWFHRHFTWLPEPENAHSKPESRPPVSSPLTWQSSYVFYFFTKKFRGIIFRASVKIGVALRWQCGSRHRTPAYLANGRPKVQTLAPLEKGKKRKTDRGRKGGRKEVREGGGKDWSGHTVALLKSKGSYSSFAEAVALWAHRVWVRWPVVPWGWLP